MFRAIRRSGGGAGAGSGGGDGATRPMGCGVRQQGTVRLDPDVLAKFREGGPAAADQCGVARSGGTCEAVTTLVVGLIDARGCIDYVAILF